MTETVGSAEMVMPMAEVKRGKYCHRGIGLLAPANGYWTIGIIRNSNNVFVFQFVRVVQENVNGQIRLA